MNSPWVEPPSTVGANRMATWMNWVERQLRAMRPIKTPTVHFDWNSKGVRYNAKAGGAGGTTLTTYVITELFGGPADEAFDYIGVTPFDTDSMTTSGGQIICAKCITARGPETELIDGNIIQYAQYYNDEQRAAYNQTTLASEFQSIHTRYVVYPGNAPPEGYDIIQSLVEVGGTTNPTGVLDPDGNDIYYYEVSPCRYWSLNPALNGA